jgi:hypothetical protein
MVKKLLYSVAFCALGTGMLNAQTNLNFETWTGNDPNGWATLNAFMTAGLPQTVYKVTTNPGEGTSSAKVTTENCSSCPGFGISDTLAGFLISGSMNMGTGAINGVPYTSRPVSFDFMYMGAPMGNDMGAAVLQLTKWNSTNGQQDVVGQGVFQTGTQASWKTQNVAVQYASADVPDTLMIIFAASGGGVFGTAPPFGPAIKGSSLTVDKVVLNMPVGVQTLEEATAGVQVYPNPSSDIINFSIINKDAKTVEVFDITGKNVMTFNVQNTITPVSVNELPAGVYVYQMKDASGVSLFTGKFNVLK